MPYVAVLAVVDVKLTDCTFIVPVGMVTLLVVRLPTAVTVLPNVKVVLPRTTLLLARLALATEMVTLAAAVNLPCWSTVKVATVLAAP